MRLWLSIFTLAVILSAIPDPASAQVAPSVPSAGASQPAAAAQGGTQRDERPDTGLLGFSKVFDLLFGGALGTGLGFLIKFSSDQFGAVAAARREFATEVTKQISKLARTHYWALGNYSGVLAAQLETYLQSRTYHLMLLWSSRQDQRERLDEIAREAAQQSFPHFCRLLALFDSFQFQGSNTYVLTSREAGDMCRRLYNMFISSLPDAATLNLANLVQKEIPVDGTGKRVRICALPYAALTDELVKQHLDAEKIAYQTWLTNSVPDVAVATLALRGYSELLNDELATLYRRWFKPSLVSRIWKIRSDSPQLSGWRYPALTSQSRDALALASYQSTLLRPIGAAVSGGPAAGPLGAPIAAPLPPGTKPSSGAKEAPQGPQPVQAPVKAA